MDTLSEYLKMKSMSTSREMGEYIADSVDISSPKNLLTSFLNYYLIARRIVSEQDQSLWQDYERAKAIYYGQQPVSELKDQAKLAPHVSAFKNNLREAKIIHLFPKRS